MNDSTLVAAGAAIEVPAHIEDLSPVKAAVLEGAEIFDQLINGFSGLEQVTYEPDPIRIGMEDDDGERIDYMAGDALVIQSMVAALKLTPEQLSDPIAAGFIRSISTYLITAQTSLSLPNLDAWEADDWLSDHGYRPELSAEGIVKAVSRMGV